MTEEFKPELVPKGTFSKEGDLKGQRLGWKEREYTEEDLAKAEIAKEKVMRPSAKNLIERRIEELTKFLKKKSENKS